MCAISKQCGKRSARYRPETELIIRHQIKSIRASKSKVKIQVKGHNQQKTHLQSLRDVCMQYESNPANGFRDIVWKRNTDTQTHAARPDIMMTISPPLLRRRGMKRNIRGILQFQAQALSTPCNIYY